MITFLNTIVQAKSWVDMCYSDSDSSRPMMIADIKLCIMIPIDRQARQSYLALKLMRKKQSKATKV